MFTVRLVPLLVLTPFSMSKKVPKVAQKTVSCVRGGDWFLATELVQEFEQPGVK